jgi:enoyl-CoA hydratase/carnithine racemase
MAAHYAAKPPIAVQMIKQSVNRLAGALDAAVMHMDTDQNLLARGTADHETAMRAKLAGTTARFTGD